MNEILQLWIKYQKYDLPSATPEPQSYILFSIRYKYHKKINTFASVEFKSITDETY